MTIWKKLSIVALVAVCSLGLSSQSNLQPAQASVDTTQAANGGTVTKIRMNGQFSSTLLNSDTYNGILTASRDRVTNTSALDFSYARETATEHVVLLIQGAGAIPNSALTMTPTSVHLAVTTSFPIIECLINTFTGEFTCTDGPPRSFDLTWVKNRLGSTDENTTLRQTFGPVTSKFSGHFVSDTADVTGTWDTETANNFSGDISDTKGTTITREITVAPTQ